MESTPEVKAQAERMVAAVKGLIARSLASINTRLSTVESRTGAISLWLGKDPQTAAKLSTFEQLEARIKALEARPTLQYRGVWSEGEDYRPGDFVTHGGSMFHCWKPTRSKPAETDAWQLCVKRGSDAKHYALR